MTTEVTSQKAQLLPSHVHVHISHQGAFQRPCLGIQTERRPAGYLPVYYKYSLYVFFRRCLIRDSYSGGHVFAINVFTVAEENEACRLTEKTFLAHEAKGCVLCTQAYHHCHQQQLCARWEFRDVLPYKWC